jgi:hypothetical protein
MQRVARLLLDMVSAGVITDYAVFGAVAQMRYTEAVSTMDAAILVGLPERPGLDILKPIYDYCVSRGYRPDGEAVRVGDWPVQFIPAFSPLTAEAMREAEIVEIEGVPLRVVSANYLALIALSAGRPKDYARVLALAENGSVSLTGWCSWRNGTGCPANCSDSEPGSRNEAMDKRIKELLERQAEWQRDRAALSWEEKLKMSLIMRETQRALRGSDSPRRNPSRKPTSTPQKE